MKELKQRLKTVRELLANAQFIRMHADVSAAGEANDWEKLLGERETALESQINRQEKHQPDLAHAE